MSKVSRLFRDCAGTSLVEFTIFFPVFFMVVFGTVDGAYMFYDWALASKAAYEGAHAAIVSDPVALGITNPSYNSDFIGEPCSNAATGLPNVEMGTATPICPIVQTVCIPAGVSGNCTNGYLFNEMAFTNRDGTGIFDRMKRIFPRLQRQNVVISYQTNNLGFVGRPGGVPMDVTVSIRCTAHEFYFIGGFVKWLYSPPAGCPGRQVSGLAMPAFATTLTSEGLLTN